MSSSYLQDEFSLPGLITEIKNILSKLDMPDMKKTSKMLWKNLVIKKMKEKNKTYLVKQSERYKKINSDEMEKENFERKPYLTNLRMDQARTKFKMKTKMLKNVKMNYKNDPKMSRNCGSVLNVIILIAKNTSSGVMGIKT